VVLGQFSNPVDNILPKVTPFELLFGEKARLPSFPNEDIQKLRYCETSVVECFNLLQKLSKTAHQFATENCGKTKMRFYRNTSAHKFKIVNKVLFSNVFSTGKNPKLVPNYKGPAKIIDINDTNAKINIGNKIKLINMQKLKLFLEEEDSEKDTHFEDLNFNENQFDGPITRTPVKLQKCCTTGIVHL
jgi:hypothetical protein